MKYIKKCLISILLGIFLSGASAVQTNEDLGWYISRAEEAIADEYYEAAVSFLREGQQLYPEAYELYQILGDLFYEKDLFTLALEEYQNAAHIVPEDFDVLRSIAHTQGKLNLNRDSVFTLENILELYPDQRNVITDLGWMYFKTYQLNKGEKLILDAMDTYGEDRSFAMTLGTIYSGMYEYEKGKKYYLLSIEDALKKNQSYFASVAYYNLSLLEHSFYNYNSSLEYTNLSLRTADRASGHLAKGELYQTKMEFSKAHEEYQNAYIIDTTPLAKINLADLYHEWGMLDLALAYADEVMNNDDTSWMYNFGIDPGRHLMELHLLYSDIYKGMANRDKLYAGNSFVNSIGSFFSGIKYSVLEWYHRQKYHHFCIRVGKTYLEEGNLLDAYWSFYKGNEDYNEVALKYLKLAKDFETSVAPGSFPFYDQEEGKIRGSIDLLLSSIKKFDPVWEIQGICNSIITLVPLLRKEKMDGEARDLLNRLYTINPGSFIRNGLGLPVIMDNGIENNLIRLLRKGGVEISFDENTSGFMYRLEIFKSISGNISYKLRDIKNNLLIISKETEINGFSGNNAEDLSIEIIGNLYSVN